MIVEIHRNLKKIWDREKGNFPKLKKNKQNKVTAVNFLVTEGILLPHNWSGSKYHYNGFTGLLAVI